MPDLTAIIPLDGTHLSEEALHLVPFLRELGVGHIRLVGAWDKTSDKHGLSEEEAQERAEGVIKAYLDERSHRLTARRNGLKVESVFRVGHPADEIIVDEVESRADLIVIATHGRAGAERWRLGSVADEVIRRASVPVIVAGPNVRVSLPEYRARRIVVPLDGMAVSEQALPAARAIAERTGAIVTLVRVVTMDNSWAVSFEDEPYVVFERIEAAAKADLKRLGAEMGWRTAILRAGYPNNVSNELNRYVADNATDLVVMTSHTRPTLERWLLSSVTEDMLRGPAPILLVKPGEVHTSRLLRPATSLAS